MSNEKEQIVSSSTETIPLSNLIQNARSFMNEAIADVIDKTRLPIYLLDGIISEILADIRRQELSEIKMNNMTVMDKESSDG